MDLLGDMSFSIIHVFHLLLVMCIHDIFAAIIYTIVSSTVSLPCLVVFLLVITCGLLLIVEHIWFMITNSSLLTMISQLALLFCNFWNTSRCGHFAPILDVLLELHFIPVWEFLTFHRSFRVCILKPVHCSFILHGWSFARVPLLLPSRYHSLDIMFSILQFEIQFPNLACLCWSLVMFGLA